MKKLKVSIYSAALWSICSAGVAHADSAVTTVNTALIDTIRASSATTPPPRASRAIGMVGIAMFDAVNAASGSAYKSYFYSGGAIKGLSQDAVALASGYTMLANLFPALSSSLTADLNTKLSALSITEAQRADSLAFGQSLANNLFAARANDGSATAQIPYVAGTNVGDFKPVQPSSPLLPAWGKVTPFGVESSSQFDVGAPPAIGSAQWIADYNQVKALGCKACGTPEQQTIANYWADGGGTFTPPGHWLSIATGLMGDLSTMEAARLTAVVGSAEADAGITAWNTKYTYNVWRPITAIQNCTVATCGVAGDPSWTPLLSTPNFPSYTSGHSTFSGAGAGALSSYFGSDDILFCTPADPKSGLTGQRCFTSLSAAANEAGLSRIYGGIHYEFDDARAIAAGWDIGEYIASNYFGLSSLSAYTGYDGVISGSRGLTVVAGREILSGVNTYTGRTTINANASLALVGNGSIAGSTGVTADGMFDISGTTAGARIQSLSGAGVVVLGRQGLTLTNASETFSGEISGTGALTIAGGTFGLSGANVLTGPTTVSAGRLNVTGSLARSSVTVQNGASLGGTGTVGSLTARSGATIAPGMSIGTLTVNGNLTLDAGSTLAVEVSPTGADRINASGTASLGGALAVNAANGAYLFNTSYMLISANSVAGNFSATSGLSGFGVAFDPTITNTSTTVLLRLRPASLVKLTGPSAGQNALEVAAAFDRAVSAGFNPQQFYNLYTQGANLSNANSQLSGEVHSAERRIALEDTRVIREAAFDRIASGMNKSADMQTASVGNVEQETTMWLRGAGSWTTARSDGRGAEFRAEQFGVLAGIDMAVSNDLKLGAMFSATHTDVDLNALGNSRVKSTGGTLYAGYKTSNFSAGVGASYAWTQMAAKRAITAPGLQQNLRSKSNGNAFQLFGEAAYDIMVGEGGSVSPFGRIAYANTKANDFGETGGIAAVSGVDEHYDITVANLGIKGDYKTGPALLSGSAAWRGIGGDRAVGSHLMIAGVNQAANIYATAFDKNAAELEAKINYAIGSKTSISVGYNGILGSRNTDHGVRATLSLVL